MEKKIWFTLGIVVVLSLSMMLFAVAGPETTAYDGTVEENDNDNEEVKECGDGTERGDCGCGGTCKIRTCGCA